MPFPESAVQIMIIVLFVGSVKMRKIAAVNGRQKNDAAKGGK